MGEVKRDYCDFCKLEIKKETFSTAGGESGEVKRRMAAWQETGDTLDGEEVDVCKSCYDKIMTWIKGRKTTAAADWKVDEPAARAVTYPKI